MKGLDLSKFKKVSSDNKCTTLQHADGHQLKIAHSALSPKMKAELDKLPIHKAQGGRIQRFAEGSEGVEAGSNDTPDSQTTGAPNPSPGVNININAQPQQPNPMPSPRPNVSPTMAPQDQMPQNAPIPLPNGGMSAEEAAAKYPGPPAQVGFNPNNPGPAPQAAQAPMAQKAIPARAPAQENMPDEGADEDQTPSPAAQPSAAMQSAPQSQPAAPQNLEQSKQAIKQDFSKEDQAWQQDLVNGHITPETYHDLFAKKDTLGKIGTIFGMMLSGAGAGLTHQPNLLVSLMDKQIANDLEAQKASKVNSQNYLRTNQERILQNAQIDKMLKEGKVNEQQAKLIKVDADTKAFALSQAQMLQASYHHLVTQVDQMPEGPQKEAAKQQLGLIYSRISDRINNINDTAAGASAYYKTLFGDTTGGSNPEQAFQKQTNAMRMMGPQGEARAKDLEEKHFPGLPGQASVPLTPGDREAINSGIDFDQKLHRFMDWTKNHSGDLSPSDRFKGAALAAELQGAYRQATHGGVYKEGEQNFISKLIDSEPTKFFNSIRVMPQLQAIAHENHARVNQLVKSKGFPGYEGAGSQQTTQPQYKIVNGVKYMRGPNGEAIPVK